MDSILTTIKVLLGIPEQHEHFDIAIVSHINTVFGTLTQLGVGPKAGFSIRDKTSKWLDFLSDMTEYEAVVSYIHLNVRLLFDPPASATITDTITRKIAELEWRLNVTAESDDTTNDTETDTGSGIVTPSYTVKIKDDVLILS